jgi:hypothetical protein
MCRYGTSGSDDNSISVFWTTSTMFSIAAASFYTNKSAQRLNFSTSLSLLFYFMGSLDSKQPNGHEVVVF